MKPPQLAAHDFDQYPAAGRQMAVRHLELLRQTPISILPTLLRDLIAYDWKFPAEQAEIAARFKVIEDHPELLRPFDSITVPASLLTLPWVQRPQEFIEGFTAHLWSSQQMDAYRTTAAEFVGRIRSMSPGKSVPMARLVMVMIGREAQPTAYPLFEKLRPHGQIWSRVKVEGASDAMMAELSRRAVGYPIPYAHWYLDGGSALPYAVPQTVTQLLYPALSPVKLKILDRMTAAIQAGSGTELLRTEFSQLIPQELSANLVTDDTRMQHFVVSLFTEGSGTQIFSTSFVQWSAREILRRAQPATMLVRFAPRQRQLSFNTMVEAAKGPASMDPQGSLIDADMGAFYTFLEMKKLVGAEQTRTVVWLEGKQQAFLAGPDIAHGTERSEETSMADLLG